MGGIQNNKSHKVRHRNACETVASTMCGGLPAHTAAQTRDPTAHRRHPAPTSPLISVPPSRLTLSTTTRGSLAGASKLSGVAGALARSWRPRRRPIRLPWRRLPWRRLLWRRRLLPLLRWRNGGGAEVLLRVAFGELGMPRGERQHGRDAIFAAADVRERCGDWGAELRGVPCVRTKRPAVVGLPERPPVRWLLLLGEGGRLQAHTQAGGSAPISEGETRWRDRCEG